MASEWCPGEGIKTAKDCSLQLGKTPVIIATRESGGAISRSVGNYFTSH